MIYQTLVNQIKLQDLGAFDYLSDDQWIEAFELAYDIALDQMTQHDPSAVDGYASLVVSNNQSTLPTDISMAGTYLIYDGDKDDSVPMVELPAFLGGDYERVGNVIQFNSTNNSTLKIYYRKEIPIITELDDTVPFTKRKALTLLKLETKAIAYKMINQGQNSNATEQSYRDANRIT